MVAGQGAQQPVVILHAHALGPQCGGGLLGQAALVDEQGGTGGGHKAVGQCKGSAVQVSGPQVQKPGHAVQPGNHHGGGTGIGQFTAQAAQLFLRGSARGFRVHQPGGSGGNRGPVLPDGADQINGQHLRALLCQDFFQLLHGGGGGDHAVQSQHLALAQRVGQILGHGGGALGAHLLQLDLAAGQLALGLDEVAAVGPEGAGGIGHHKGAHTAGEAGEVGPGLPVVGQIFAGMGIRRGDQAGIRPGGLHGRPQLGDLFVGGFHGICFTSFLTAEAFRARRAKSC